MAPTRYYCTYFDRNYLTRGLCLYGSLHDRGGPFRLFCLCLDGESADAVDRLRLPEITTIRVEELLADDLALQEARINRSAVEFYFTCTASLSLFVLNTNSEIDRITYVDADLFFFSDPEDVYAEAADSSIAIIAHRAPNDNRLQFGIYNVGWLSFKRDESGLGCLTWWRERCLEWCYDRVEDGKFADQKYLDNWPTQFENVHVIDHVGANAAPWNVGATRVTAARNGVEIDDRPLLFFHFHGLKRQAGPIWTAGLGGYGVTLGRVLRRGVYAPYMAALTAVEAGLQQTQGTTATSPIGSARDLSSKPWFLRRWARTCLRTLHSLRYRDYVVQPRAEAVSASPVNAWLR